MLQITPRCPKCSHSLVHEGEMYYCTFPDCLEFFSVHELVHQWGFDVADLYGKVMYTNFPEPIQEFHFDYVSAEPMWLNESERIYGYEFVNEMLYGIGAHDDYQDLLNTYECAR